jgi:hypothetical protein
MPLRRVVLATATLGVLAVGACDRETGPAAPSGPAPAGPGSAWVLEDRPEPSLPPPLRKVVPPMDKVRQPRH